MAKTGIPTDQAEACTLLSSLYLCRPSEESIRNWKSVIANDSFGLLGGLKNTINGIDEGSSKEVDGLLWEYTRLFIGPYRLPCPPWESVYTSPKGLMMQDAANEVTKLYAALGLIMNDQDAMPDHIGAELNFLALLLNKTGKSKAENYAIRDRFVKEHLYRWVPTFTQDMERAAESALYKTLARATRDFLAVVGSRPEEENML